MKFPKHKWRWLLGASSLVLLGAIGSLIWAQRACQLAAEGRMFSTPESIPFNDVGLVLGTSKLTAAGRPNLHFQQRIVAAVALYESGKVRHLIVSGDNQHRSYDEPTDMLRALEAAGVPTNAITRDYAGLRTLDSVVRASLVFGLTNFTIVTEEFHCPRALWIARARGLNAVAFAAPDPVAPRWTLRVRTREAFARVLCGLDLYVFRTQPKFSGPPEPIVISQN